MSATSGQAIADRYIVVFKDSAEDGAVATSQDTVRDDGGTIHFNYQNAIHGYAASMGQSTLSAIRGDPAVDYVEVDQRTTTANESASFASVTVGEGHEAGVADSPQDIHKWNQDRIDQRVLPLEGIVKPRLDGTGVRAYIIGPGVDRHTWFGSRLEFGFGPEGDCSSNDRGTHAAGTVGSDNGGHGLATGARLVAVRVHDATCTASASAWLAGVDWVKADAMRFNPQRSVVLMAMTEVFVSDALDAAEDEVRPGGMQLLLVNLGQ